MKKKTNNKHNIKCVYCGRFLSYKELEEGTAVSEFIPDSHYTRESIIFEHKECPKLNIFKIK